MLTLKSNKEQLTNYTDLQVISIYLSIYLSINVLLSHSPSLFISIYLSIYPSRWLVGRLFGFYGISTFVGYLTPNPFL